MRRLLVILVALAVVMLAVPASAGAAPANGNSATDIVLDCEGGEDVTVLVQFNTGSAAVFDAALATDGRRYVLSYLADRIVDTATGELVLASERAWGQRKGYSETLVCSGSVELTEFGVTWFGDTVVLSGK